MLRVSSAFSLTAFVTLVGAALFFPAVAQPRQENQSGIRGRVIIAAELLGATDWPLTDWPAAAERAKALATAGYVRRPQGRALLTMTEPAPDISIVVQGESVPADDVPPKTLVIEGMRFVPSEVLLPRSGKKLKLENKQGVAVTVLDEAGKAVHEIAAGETWEMTPSLGLHSVSLKGMPYATATILVLRNGRFLVLNETGELKPLALTGDDYLLSFYFGAEAKTTTKLKLASGGQLFIDATISANRVVDVNVVDASVRFDVPPE